MEYFVRTKQRKIPKSKNFDVITLLFCVANYLMFQMWDHTVSTLNKSECFMMASIFCFELADCYSNDLTGMRQYPERLSLTKESFRTTAYKHWSSHRRNIQSALRVREKQCADKCRVCAEIDTNTEVPRSERALRQRRNLYWYLSSKSNCPRVEISCCPKNIIIFPCLAGRVPGPMESWSIKQWIPEIMALLWN